MGYRLDKSIARIQTFEEADNQAEYWQTQTIGERLRASWYLTCQAFGLDYSSKHKLDKTVHSVGNMWIIELYFQSGFSRIYTDSIEANIDGVLTRVIHKNQLILAKRASNRAKDQDDIDHLID